ncbi:hypothetical protein CEP51_012187 [Fusarium floridanum]|uniref:Fungal N-terminal domain-containing protein n=1 Tax=Fusarium floridanum TaxID=1325733 RepID=A0A428QYS8_9HYPO|nr:hypothetical protein CEP51_012187 [Fusarium floridanum]
MADPLSLAASIAGLISLADVTFKYVYRFAKAAKDAKDDVQTLADQVNDLARVLRVPEALAESLEIDGEGFDPALRNHYLGHCHKTLEKVQKRASKALDSFNSGSKSKSLVRQLKWPFSASETASLLNEISSHKATINLALSADSMRKLQLSLSKTSELGNRVVAIQETLRRIEINTLIKVDDKKERVLNFFMAVNPQPNLETSVRLRHALTGLWLTESPAFENWLHTPGSRLWLTGIPGAGKTILAGAVIQEVLTYSYAAPEIGAAFFFCDYNDPSTWNTTNILGAIASQLARQKEEVFDILGEYYDELHPPHGLARTPDSDELRARISQMSERFDQTLVVIDGLDECGDETEDVVGILREVADYSERVSMALFSRDHFNIRIRLDQDFEVIHIAAHTEDIRQFVGAELGKRIKNRRLQLNDMSMKYEIAEVLVHRAEGMYVVRVSQVSILLTSSRFRWVVCQLDYLCDCAHDGERREALEKLPPDLPESYRRLLQRINKASVTVQSMVHMCLSFIAFARPALSILQLCQAVSTPSAPGKTLTERNTVTEEEILRRCSSLIRKSQDGKRFEFAHFTVQEFLEDRVALGDGFGIDRYLISKQSSDLLLATQCLRFLQMKNFEPKLIEADTKHHLNDDDLVRMRNEHYPFYPYSAIFWMHLTRDGLDDPTLFNLANSLFHPSKTSHFTSWSRELVNTLMGHDGRSLHGGERNEPDLFLRIVLSPKQGVPWHQRILDVGFGPLHMAAALNIPEICSSLVSQGVPVNSRWDNIRPIDLAFASVIEFSGLLPKHFESDILVFLPVNRRRNLTIESLIRQGARPSNHLLYSRGNSVFSHTATISALLNDVTPIVCLLSLGAVPDDRELSIFDECFHRMDHTNAEAKSSMISLLRVLDSESFGDEGWAKKLCSVVSRWCAKARLSFSEHDPLFDAHRSPARDFLPARMIQAIVDDDVELTKRYLAASQIDAVEYRHDGGTLLHLAAGNDACDVFEFLIAAGSDPYCEDINGRLPIHVHDFKSGIRFYETLKRLGISLLNPDTRGMTIWHNLAKNRPLDEQLFQKLIQLDREGTGCALQTRTLADETLLSIVLRPEALVDMVESERIFFSLLDVCSELPDFWLSHGPIMDAAAYFGSGNVVRRLVDAGAEFEPAIEGTRTPLHELSGLMPLQEAQMLVDAYQYAIEYKFRDLLPVEMYIVGSIWRQLAPNPQVIKMLTTPGVLRNKDAGGRTLWEFVCTLPSQIGRYELEMVLTKLIDNIMMTMVELGAMKVYEERNQVCGVMLALGMASQYRSRPQEDAETAPCYIAVDTVHEMLRQAQYWASGRNSFSVQQFLELAIHRGDLEMVRLLLEHQVDIHCRFQGTSALEEACNHSEKHMLRLFIDHCKSDKLDDTSPEDGLRLLHRLALRPDTADTVWLMESLIQRGADVNLLTDDEEAIAIELDDVEFLQQVLSLSVQISSIIDWGKSMKIPVLDLWLEEANALHLASAKGSLPCLEFLLEKNLIKVEVSKTKEGWTPLHVSAFMGYAKTTELLIFKGCHVMAENVLGQTPLHLAVYRDDISAVEMLRKHGASESLDGLGKSPWDYAQGRDLAGLVRYFEAWRDEVGNWGDLSRNPPRALAAALGRAIEAGDKEKCWNLISKGCPIDLTLPGTGGCTPLMLASRLGNLDIAAWFLNQGASTLKSAQNSDWTVTSIIEAATSNPNFNTLLSGIVDSYYKCGGDLVCGVDFPLHEAVWSGNTEGIKIILQIWEKLESAAQLKPYPDSTCRQVLQTIVNRRQATRFLFAHARGQGWQSRMVTALHVASWTGNKVAASILVERGADVDCIDCNGWTPLIYANTVDMITHLISLGASPDMVCRISPLPWFMSRFGMEELPFDLISKLSRRLILNLHFPVYCGDIPVTPHRLTALRQLGCDLAQEDECGRSLMHCIIYKDETSQLVLEGGFGLCGISPFPWHLDWCPFGKTAFLTTRFRDFQQRVPRETFRTILNLEPQCGWSPLCRAAGLNLIDIMENCLEMGARVDYEGCPLGSAIMFASTCGSLEAVKLLVRRGASVCYFGQNGFTSCYVLAGTEAIRSWLLAGRFMDQQRITAEGGGGKDAVRPWSGFASARVKIYGKREKYQAESMLEYAKRLAQIKKELGGQLVRAYEVSLPGEG